jgi:hypothetical protein
VPGLHLEGTDVHPTVDHPTVDHPRASRTALIELVAREAAP